MPLYLLSRKIQTDYLHWYFGPIYWLAKKRRLYFFWMIFSIADMFVWPKMYCQIHAHLYTYGLIAISCLTKIIPLQRIKEIFNYFPTWFKLSVSHRSYGPLHIASHNKIRKNVVMWINCADGWSNVLFTYWSHCTAVLDSFNTVSTDILTLLIWTKTKQLHRLQLLSNHGPFHYKWNSLSRCIWALMQTTCLQQAQVMWHDNLLVTLLFMKEYARNKE